MTQTTDRRQNSRTANCRSCGAYCEAGKGYLYFDRAKGWFVKCQDCNAGQKTRATVKAERRALTHPIQPTVRPWTITQVRKWTVELVTRSDDVAVVLRTGTAETVMSFRDPITSRFTANSLYEMDGMDIDGKPISLPSAKHLDSLIYPLVEWVQKREQVAGEAAALRLVIAGATAVLRAGGHGWQVDYKGGRYTMWGCVDGKNEISGFTCESGENRRWIETTVEQLISDESLSS